MARRYTSKQNSTRCNSDDHYKHTDEDKESNEESPVRYAPSSRNEAGEQLCLLHCCRVPVVPEARIHFESLEAHRLGRSDRNSIYWKRVRAATKQLDEDAKQRVQSVSVTRRVDSLSGAVLSPLEQKLIESIQGRLLCSAPKQQLLRSFMLTGPPGTSKTHALHSVASALDLSLIVVNPSVLISRWAGEAGKTLTSIMQLANLHQPCMLLFDDCDFYLGKRCTQQGRSEDIRNIVTCMMPHMQGDHDSQPGIIIACCTNHPERIDSAIISRVTTFKCTVRDAEMRRVVWSNQLNQRQLQPTQDELQALVNYKITDIRIVAKAITKLLGRRKHLAGDYMSELPDILKDIHPEPESDDELDDGLDLEKMWRRELLRFLKPQLNAHFTSIGKRIHLAIPAHTAGWQICVSNGASKVNAFTHRYVGPFHLTLGEKKNSWAVQSPHSTAIVVLNIDDPKSNTRETKLSQELDATWNLQQEKMDQLIEMHEAKAATQATTHQQMLQKEAAALATHDALQQRMVANYTLQQKQIDQLVENSKAGAVAQAAMRKQLMEQTDAVSARDAVIASFVLHHAQGAKKQVSIEQAESMSANDDEIIRSSAVLTDQQNETRSKKRRISFDTDETANCD
jgi:hypothetical protein